MKGTKIMMRSKILPAALATALIASSMPVPAFAASRAYCQDYARHKANRKAGAQQVVTGAAVGALLGLGVGAIVGGHHAQRKGALIGGGVGAVAGGVDANNKWRYYYDKYYSQCRRSDF
jgi:uncharacterized protein YcfJ